MSVLACVLLALTAADEPPVERPKALTVEVDVSAIHPSGAVRRALGAEVRLERSQAPPPGQGGGAHLVAAWRGVAGDGPVIFDGLPLPGTAESDTAVVRYHGVESRWPVEQLSPRAGGIQRASAFAVVFEPSRDVSDLTMSVRLTIEARDSGLQIEHVFEIENPTQRLIDTDQGPGLVMPLVTPAPFGEPVASFLPARPEPREFLTRYEPPDQGRLLIERGRLVYRGYVGMNGVRVRVIYLLPYDGETSHSYGLRMPLPATELSLVQQSSERVQPNVRFVRPSDVQTREFMDGQRRTAILLDPPAAGEVVLIDVAGTPDRHVLYRPLVAGLGMALVALLVILALGRRRDGDVADD